VSTTSFAITQKASILSPFTTFYLYRRANKMISQCDQEKPKCGACRKRDRQCLYSYGRVTAFVAEDPVYLTKHGKSNGASVVRPLSTSADDNSATSTSHSPSSDSTSSDDLRMTTAKAASDDKGVFMTLTIMSKHEPKSVRKRTAQQRKKLQDHLNRLRWSPELTLHRLVSPESTLAARYIDILGPRALKDQPLAILGSWVETIPSRIGSSSVVDLALEYFTDTFAVFRDDSFSARSVALASKAKALKQLQLSVSENHTRATYDTVLAMKLHFAAEVRGPCCTFYNTSADLLADLHGNKISSPYHPCRCTSRGFAVGTSSWN
jgi:hypothetical protein